MAFLDAKPKCPKGRLLTPEEGCGYSKVPATKIVGGSPAKKGKFDIESIYLRRFLIASNGSELNRSMAMDGVVVLDLRDR